MKQPIVYLNLSSILSSSKIDVPLSVPFKTHLLKSYLLKYCTISLFVILAIFVAVSEFPVNSPIKPVAVTLPVEGL